MAATTHSITERDSKGSFVAVRPLRQGQRASPRARPTDSFLHSLPKHLETIIMPAITWKRLSPKPRPSLTDKLRPRQVGYLEAPEKNLRCSARELGLPASPNRVQMTPCSDLIAHRSDYLISTLKNSAKSKSSACQSRPGFASTVAPPVKSYRLAHNWTTTAGARALCEIVSIASTAEGLRQSTSGGGRACGFPRSQRR